MIVACWFRHGRDRSVSSCDASRLFHLMGDRGYFSLWAPLVTFKEWTDCPIHVWFASYARAC